MNMTHLHLMLNHFPVIGLIFGILFLVFAFARKRDELKKLSLWIFVIVALIALPAFITGEPAEKTAKHLPGVAGWVIERHEHMAAVSFAAVEVIGFIALSGLIAFRRSNPVRSWFIMVMFVFSVIGSGLMGVTANLGGQIRHTEIRKDYNSTALSSGVMGHRAVEDDD